MPIICEIREKKLTCENIWKPFLLVSKIVVTVYWFSFFSGTTQIVSFHSLFTDILTQKLKTKSKHDIKQQKSF